MDSCSVPLELLVSLILSLTNPGDIVFIWNPSQTPCFRNLQVGISLGREVISITTGEEEFEKINNFKFDKEKWMKKYLIVAIYLIPYLTVSEGCSAHSQSSRKLLRILVSQHCLSQGKLKSLLLNG